MSREWTFCGKVLSFILMLFLVVIMMTATILEKSYGSEFVHTYIYSSYWFVSVWVLFAISACLYIIGVRKSLSLTVLSFHVSMVIILLGALLTYLTSVQGRLHIRMNEGETNFFVTSEKNICYMPFSISLDTFNVEYYKGTFSPMDYVSGLKINDDGKTIKGTVSMNNILSYRNYRFYQSSYDADAKGSTLSVSYDPWGIAVTYTGYICLFITMVVFFFTRKTVFRALLGKRSMLIFALLFLCMPDSASFIYANDTNNDKYVLPENVADDFGRLLVYYNGRICPLQTMSDDVSRKITGKKNFDGLTSEQFVTGWLFYYDEWKDKPVIRVKSSRVKDILGITGDYASLSDFVGKEGYKLATYLQNEDNVKIRREIEEANEKFNIISMLSTGSMFRIYPVRNNEESSCVWYSVSDKLPDYVSVDKWNFVKYSMNYVAENIASGNMEEVLRIVSKISSYQLSEADGLIPDNYRIKAEHIYNTFANIRLVALICLTVGICAFLMYIKVLAGKSSVNAVFDIVMRLGMFLLSLYLLSVILLRWIVAGHFPVSNGFETMVFMAFVTSLITIVTGRYIHVMRGNIYAFGYIVAGFSLLVAMIGESNPPVTPLMPVLSSPLLSIHVVTIMLSYSLFSFMMLNGIAVEFLYRTSGIYNDNIKKLTRLSRIMLYPAIFLLVSGIFIGAVWANVSWGRYWGWDPKEVWALITMFIYSLPLHAQSLPFFRNMMFFHRYMIIAFISVLITYFGVNFVLGGMHGYA